MAITISDAINKQKENTGFKHVPAGGLCSTHNLVPPQKDINEDTLKKAVDKIYPNLEAAVPIENVEEKTISSEPLKEKIENA